MKEDQRVFFLDLLGRTDSRVGIRDATLRAHRSRCIFAGRGVESMPLL